MPISRSRRLRQAPVDLRYHPYFPRTYISFIKTVPYEYRLHVKQPGWGGSDETGDGSWERPYATVDFARSQIPLRMQGSDPGILKHNPYIKLAVIVFPGDYVTKGEINIRAQEYPDNRQIVFTDYYHNPILNLTDNARYETTVTESPPDKSGRVKTTVTKRDRYQGHFALAYPYWFYEVHYIGASGKSKIYYSAFPDYYNPVTNQYRGAFAVKGTNKLAYLGLFPNIYSTARTYTQPAPGSNVLYQNSFTFTAVTDGWHTIKYYVEDISKDNTKWTVAGLESNAKLASIDFDETYNWYYIDQPNNDPSGNLQISEVGNAGNLTLSGIAYIDDTFKRTGNSSLNLNKEGGAFMTYRRGDAANVWDQDFTVEAWVYLGQDSGTLYVVADESAKRLIRNYRLWITGGQVHGRFHHKNSFYSAYGYGGNVGKNEWQHVGMQRSGEYVYILQNGSIVDVQPSSWTSPPTVVGQGNSTIYIGMFNQGSPPRTYAGSTNAWVDGVRITKGVARYLEDGITIPTDSLTNDSDTLFLMNCDRDYIDRGSFDLAIQKTGPAELLPYSPFSETGNVANSILFTPYNWYSTPHSTDFNLGTNFTVDFWLFRPSTATGSFAVMAKPYSIDIYFTNYQGYVSLGNNGTTFNLRQGWPGWPETSLDEWTHYMMSREGNIVRFLKSGTIVNTISLSSSAALATNTSNLMIGSSTETGSRTEHGIIHGLRINNNVALGANTYDVPEVEYVIPGGDTSNVLLFATTSNLETDGSTYGHPIVRRYSRGGTAQTNLAANTAGVPFSPFGIFPEGTSLRLQNNRPKRIGTTSRYETRELNMVYIPNTPLGNSDWTVELWLKFASYRDQWTYGISTGYFISNALDPFNLKTGEFALYNFYTTPYLRWKQLTHKTNKDGIPRIAGENFGSGTIVPTDWNHFVIQNAGNFLKYWVNGTLLMQRQTMMNVGAVDQYGRALEWTNNGLWIGRPREQSSSYYSDFQYHDLRVTSTAVYSANVFTPPSEPLTSVAGTTHLLFNSPTNIFTSATAYQGTDPSRPTAVRDSPYQSGTGKGSILVHNTMMRTNKSAGRDSNRIKGIGQGDFTFEGFLYKPTEWVNINSESIFEAVPWAGPAMYLLARKVSGQFYLRIRFGVGNLPGGRSSYSTYYDVIAPAPKRRWFHWAISRTNGSIQVYWDGKLIFAKGGIFCNLDDSAVYFGGGELYTSRFIGYMGQNRVSKIARYSSSYTVPNDPFNLATDPHASNVILQANFDGPYYKHQPSQVSSTTTQPGYSWGHSNKVNLTAGAHTLFTSAIATSRQQAIGWEVLDPAGKIIFESRKDARDNNLSYLRHPNSTVRGFHILYSGAKAEYHQNALFGGPYVGLAPQKWIEPRNIKGNQYNPYDPKFTVQTGQVRVVRKTLPDKTVETTNIIGNLSLLNPFEFGTWINCGIEGTNLVFMNKNGAMYTQMQNCTFRYPVGGIGRGTVLDKVKPAISNSISSYAGSGAGAYTGNLVINNSVLGVSIDDVDNNAQAPIYLNYFKKRPAHKRGAETRSYVFPVIDNSVYSACIQANTFIITNNVLPALSTESLITFSEFGTTVNTNAGSTNKQPTSWTLANGAVTASLVPSAASTGSLYMPNVQPSTNWPTVTLNKNLLPDDTDFWSISFDMYHAGPVSSTVLAFENLLILGDYQPRDRKYYLGRILPNTWQFVVTHAGVKVDRPTANPPVIWGDPKTYYKLRILRRSSPWDGEAYNIDVSAPNELRYQFRTDTWYNVKLAWDGKKIAVYYDGVLVNSNDFYSERSTRSPAKYPQFGFRYNNQARTVIGKIPDLPLNSMAQGGFTHSNFKGYIANLRTTTGSEVQENQVGVYTGTYKWVL